MDRKKFLKNSALGLGAFVGISGLNSSCKESRQLTEGDHCQKTPREVAGPFPIRTPADWVRANVVGDRTGIPLLVNFVIQNIKNDCQPWEGAYVDIWQCDAKGNYSEYKKQLDGDFTKEHFLRGRQTTDSSGQVSFISIYPGWYPGRAPHIHVEVLSEEGKSLLVTQVAFPEDVSEKVYAGADYRGKHDTSNLKDFSFRNSLDQNIVDSITGNNEDGYTLTKVIKVAV
jgi:protocatechuate 3,4-dioxygenase beta subunit